MNRTTAFLSVAAALALLAVVVGIPNRPVATPPAPPAPAPAPSPAPTPPPAPAGPGSLTLSGNLSHPRIIPGTTSGFATVTVTAVSLPNVRRAPVNLAVVLDRSGSMSGSKIADAKRAAARLVELLGPDDRLAVVHYGNDVSVLPGTFATEEGKRRLHRFIAAIQEEGGTNIGAGLEAGRRQIEQAQSDFKVNRLVLLSDGQPTVGLTSPRALSALVERAREHGISVTSLGVGADFNEDLMQHLADVGGGSFGFISERDGALMARIFEKDLTQAGTLVAQGVKLTLVPGPGVVLHEVFGRLSERTGEGLTVTLPDFSAGQAEKLVVRLSVTTAQAAGTVDVASAALGYRDLLAGGAGEARLSLASLVTDDAQVVRQAQDKDAVVFATRARAAANTKAAAEFLAVGSVEKAKEALQKNAVLFDEAASVAGEDALRADRAAQQQAYELSAKPAASEPERRERAKSLKVQAWKGEGRGDSVY